MPPSGGGGGSGHVLVVMREATVESTLLVVLLRSAETFAHFWLVSVLGAFSDLPPMSSGRTASIL